MEEHISEGTDREIGLDWHRDKGIAALALMDPDGNGDVSSDGASAPLEPATTASAQVARWRGFGLDDTSRKDFGPSDTRRDFDLDGRCWLRPQWLQLRPQQLDELRLGQRPPWEAKPFARCGLRPKSSKWQSPNKRDR